MKRKILPALFIILACLAGTVCRAEETEKIVYVGGNSRDYPVEYYDAHSGSFRGIMPDILEYVSERTGIRFVYMDPSLSVEELTRDVQVDLVSDFRGNPEDGVVCLEFPAGDGKEPVGIVFTRILEEETRKEIREAVEGMSPAEREEILLKNLSERAFDYYRPYVSAAAWAAGTAGTFLLLLCIVLFGKYKRLKNKLLYKDLVTGGRNSASLARYYGRKIREENRNLYCVVDLYMENFSRIKELYGFSESAFLLSCMSAGMQGMLTGQEYGARVSSDHFIMLLRHASRDKQEIRLKEMMAETAKKAAEAGRDYELYLTCGVYELSYRDESLETPIYNAVQARREAASKGKPVGYYEEKLTERIHYDRQLEQDVKRALADKEFTVWYQPKLETSGFRIRGYETLARWQHPSRGLLFPEQFLTVLKERHWLRSFDMVLFEGVCERLAERIREKKRLLPVSFNFSRESLEEEGFCRWLVQTKQDYGILDGILEVEISEIVESSGAEDFAGRIGILKAAGFRITLEHFGSGNASFLELERCMVDSVKLDKELAANMDKERVGRIVEGIADMCHKIGICLECSGVEDARQAELLVKAGCDVLQGYYYYYPLPYEETEALEERLEREAARRFAEKKKVSGKRKVRPEGRDAAGRLAERIRLTAEKLLAGAGRVVDKDDGN